MRCTRTALLLAPTLAAACAGNPDRHTLAELRDVRPDVAEVLVEDGLDRAMLGYERFLAETPESALTPEAMRRLADLKLEKEYGLLGEGDLVELPAPEARAAARGVQRESSSPVAGIANPAESERDFERRALGEAEIMPSGEKLDLELPGDETVAAAGPLEAIELYDRILAAYPTYPHNDQVLYQKARAYDELGRPDEAIAVIERLVAEYPRSEAIDEVHFRRAEYFFTRKKYFEAEKSYAAITETGPSSEYYELALYKLGWTLYKQMMHEEALHEYFALLDHKVSIGYDFDQSLDEAGARRIEDTYRVISLCFSNLGGPEVVAEYFTANGQRSYENRIYSQHGEFYLDKLRYNDAAAVYQAFVELYPLHQASPHFSMRVVEIYEAGGFPKLVLESKKQFAATYGLQSEYWRHFDVGASPEVRSYLKSNLADLANHYHALYQGEEHEDERPVHFQEASHWYRAYLDSFPRDTESPGVNHQLADLLLEHGDFGEAAREYELTAYQYPEHERAGAAGYAAIYAHREHQKQAMGDEQAVARRNAVTSTLRFVDTFPEHEHSAVVLGAAVDDLYDMKEFEEAIATGQHLIDDYPEAELSIRRSAWAVIAHSSFEIADYEASERAYARVLEMTPAEDDSRSAVVDNLAAAIYKQGEQARLAEDHRAAADHFLRISQAAPSSDIRPAAEYDAGAALIRLEDWTGAVAVLEAFRHSHPDHELEREATKQIALVYREQGNLAGAAEEYERVAAEADEAAPRREALLLAGQLYEDSELGDRALAVYLRYVDQFPEPLEIAVETRFKIAGIYEASNHEAGYHEQLQRVVEIDESAGSERTARMRYLAAQSALVLSESLYHRFDEVRLVQPFEQSLQEKQRRMDAALGAFGRLVDYEVGEVTAAATFYMAEVYSRFSQALLGSERPADLEPAELQDYEMVLEQEAFPFEEKAIDVHEKNLELMAAGIYNAWIAGSLDKLAALVPGRYAKFEASSGFIASLDSYAHRAPSPGGGGLDEPAPLEAAWAAGGAPAHEVESVEATPASLAPAPAEAHVVEASGSGAPASRAEPRFGERHEEQEAGPLAAEEVGDASTP
jgi:TolA-binding protein